MTVAKVTIEPHEEHPEWFRMTIESWRNSIGQTKIELLVSKDSLRQMRREIEKIAPPPNPDDLLPFMREK